MAKNRSPLTISRNTVAAVASTLVLASAIVLSGFHVLAASCSSTADCQQQINNVNGQISQSQSSLAQLATQAQSYEAAKAQLQSQIGSLQAQINANVAEQATLQGQIVAAQQQLEQQKSVLSDDLKSLYVGGQTTPIEMLATSSNLSEYVDKQEAYTALQNKIQDTLKKIAALQSTLQDHKNQVDTLVANERTQSDQLASAEAQQQQLLNYNQSQQAAYNQQLASSKSSLGQLKARLAALNTTSDSTINASGNCGGTYPTSATNHAGGHWGCDYGQDSGVDNWNMLNRECVSYTAWMASTKFGVSTSGWGSAYQWITAAENHNFTVDQNPAVGAIAIRARDYSEPGDVGHAMYVVAVNGADSITVNEFNEHYDGKYDQRTFSPSSYDSRGGLYYIHL